jgi:hypothetical protein
MTKDVIMELVNQASASAIKKHGGVEGYFKHLQKLDLARRKSKKRPGQKRRSSLARKA